MFYVFYFSFSCSINSFSRSSLLFLMVIWFSRTTCQMQILRVFWAAVRVTSIACPSGDRPTSKRRLGSFEHSSISLGGHNRGIILLFMLLLWCMELNLLNGESLFDSNHNDIIYLTRELLSYWFNILTVHNSLFALKSLVRFLILECNRYLV